MLLFTVVNWLNASIYCMYFNDDFITHKKCVKKLFDGYISSVCNYFNKYLIQS